MKCEICQSADAEQAIRRNAEGQEQELYVCSCCAHEAQPAKQKKNDSLKKKSSKTGVTPLEEVAGVLPDLVGMLIDATLEIMNHPSLSEETSCPHCGITRSEYRKASRLGCAMCYRTFAKELGNLIADMHYHPKHKGKAPRHPGKEES